MLAYRKTIAYNISKTKIFIWSDCHAKDIKRIRSC